MNNSIMAAFMVPHPPIIVPEIGRGEEKKIQKTIDAYNEVADTIAKLKPETIVLISPHQVMYSDYFHISPGNNASGDFGQFRAPQVKMDIKYDGEFVNELCKLAASEGLSAGIEGERDARLDHGTMVPLYFVNKYYKDYELVRIGLSGLSFDKHFKLGKCIKLVADKLNKRVVFIASGDLSHRLKADGPYGYRKEGPEYDSRIMEVMGSGDFLKLFDFTEEFCENAGECGHRSFVIMAGALDGMGYDVKPLSYEGTFGVGYGVCSYLPQN